MGKDGGSSGNSRNNSFSSNSSNSSNGSNNSNSSNARTASPPPPANIARLIEHVIIVGAPSAYSSSTERAAYNQSQNSPTTGGWKPNPLSGSGDLAEGLYRAAGVGPEDGIPREGPHGEEERSMTHLWCDETVWDDAEKRKRLTPLVLDCYPKVAEDASSDDGRDGKDGHQSSDGVNVGDGVRDHDNDNGNGNSNSNSKGASNPRRPPHRASISAGDLEQLPQFCFPTGVKPETLTVSARDSMSALNQVLYDHAGFKRGSNSFVFTLGTDDAVPQPDGAAEGCGASGGEQVSPQATGGVLYGVCIIVRDVLAVSSILTPPPPPPPPRKVQTSDPTAHTKFRTYADMMREKEASKKAQSNPTVPVPPTKATPQKMGTKMARFGKRFFGGKADAGSGDPPPLQRSSSSPSSTTRPTGGGDDGRYVIVPRCYCLLSRWPYLKELFEILQGMLGKERVERMLVQVAREEQRSTVRVASGYAERGGRRSSNRRTAAADADVDADTDADADAALSSLVCTSTRRDSLGVQLSRSKLGGSLATASGVVEVLLPCLSPGVRAIIEDLLWRIEAPPPGGIIEDLYLCDELSPITFHRPEYASFSEEKARRCGEWGLPVLLKTLSLDRILMVLGCALLELKIVFVSSSCARLSAAVLGLASLLYPLTWSGPIITVVPDGLQDVLSSPVPIIVGALSTLECLSSEDVTEDDQILRVDLDQGWVTLPERLLPLYHTVKLPQLDTLYHDLSADGDLFRRDGAALGAGGTAGVTGTGGGRGGGGGGGGSGEREASQVYGFSEEQVAAAERMQDRISEHVGELVREANVSLTAAQARERRRGTDLYQSLSHFGRSFMDEEERNGRGGGVDKTVIEEYDHDEERWQDSPFMVCFRDTQMVSDQIELTVSEGGSTEEGEDEGEEDSDDSGFGSARKGNASRSSIARIVSTRAARSGVGLAHIQLNIDERRVEEAGRNGCSSGSPADSPSMEDLWQMHGGEGGGRASAGTRAVRVPSPLSSSSGGGGDIVWLGKTLSPTRQRAYSSHSARTSKANLHVDASRGSWDTLRGSTDESDSNAETSSRGTTPHRVNGGKASSPTLLSPTRHRSFSSPSSSPSHNSQRRKAGRSGGAGEEKRGADIWGRQEGQRGRREEDWHEGRPPLLLSTSPGGSHGEDCVGQRGIRKKNSVTF
jgi:hypothetical protein